MKQRRANSPATLGAALVLSMSVVAGGMGLQAARASAPTAAQIKTRLVRAVSASHAHLRSIAVDDHRRKLRLDVSVADPAAYLKHRYARVVRVIYPGLVSRFAYIHLTVFDRLSGRAVLTYSDTPGFGPGATRQQAWHIAPALRDCARNLPLDDIEIDPDHTAPPYPAR